ncbi:hypothetical protein PIB30_068309 [Stylosanthes scabra]|uniref:Uncharacterized protein n=1 Tax=Stylosanthes scabra TaxID=79078 RepID=A0ABU6ZLH4_9FABA|nr:hypothetical protein [Stylosanthes scabra]
MAPVSVSCPRNWWNMSISESHEGKCHLSVFSILVLNVKLLLQFHPSMLELTVPCGGTLHHANARSKKCAALILYPRGRTSVACGRAGLGRLRPETLPRTHANARGDRAAARCPTSHFLASSCESFAFNVFLSLLYAILNP